MTDGVDIKVALLEQASLKAKESENSKLAADLQASQEQFMPTFALKDTENQGGNVRQKFVKY